MDQAECGSGCACGDRATGSATAAQRVQSAPVTRRGVLAGSAAVMATLALGACASPDEGASSTTPAGPAATPDSTSDAPSPSGTDASPDSGSTGEVLATTGEFPTGGGKVVQTATAGVVVVTQPADGQFKAYSGKCPHQGCPVTEVLENTIICNCHGSTFDAANGDRLEGPAPVGLTPVAISVEGDEIVLA